MSTGTDPLDFVLGVLHGLPRDPRDTTAEDLHVLESAQEGMVHHARRLADAAAALEERLDDTADLQGALRDRAALARLEARTRLAAARLDAFTVVALRAHDINPAATGGDDQTGAP
jgi:hypothetical protein